MIQKFANWLVYDIAGLDSASKLGSSVNFFVYDSIKILVLLFLISIFMGILNAYFPVQKLRKFLTTRKLYGTQYILASVFGAITPFCSCSSIPLFIGFVKGGIPLGVTFSFLITSPLINEVAVAVFAGAFGWKITAVYISSGLFLALSAAMFSAKCALKNISARGFKNCKTTAIRKATAGRRKKFPSSRVCPKLYAILSP